MPVFKRPIPFTLPSGEKIAAHPYRLLAIAEIPEPAGTELFFEDTQSVIVQDAYDTVLGQLRGESYLSLTEFHHGRRAAVRVELIDYIQETTQPGENQIGSGTIIHAGDAVFSVREDYAWVYDRYMTIDPLKTFPVSAYAEMYEANVDFTSLGSGWTPVVGYSENSVEPRLIVTDLVAGTFIFPYEEIYELSIGIHLNHNESNQGRQTNVRFFNVTDGVAQSKLIPISIGRNQPGLNFSYVFKVDIAENEVSKAFRLEIGGGSSITVSGGSVSFGAKMLSPWEL